MKHWQIWPAVLIVAAGTFAKGWAQDPPIVPQQTLPYPQQAMASPPVDSSVAYPPMSYTGTVYQGTDFDPYVSGPYGVPYIPVGPTPPPVPARSGHWWKKPCGCYANVNCEGCWNCKADYIFVFGSCRKFFSQPCLKEVPPVPLPEGYTPADLRPQKPCNCSP
jgi:hypothetical protein